MTTPKLNGPRKLWKNSSLCRATTDAWHIFPRQPTHPDCDRRWPTDTRTPLGSPRRVGSITKPWATLNLAFAHDHGSPPNRVSPACELPLPKICPGRVATTENSMAFQRLANSVPAEAGDSSFTAEPKATAGPQAAICSCGADWCLRRQNAAYQVSRDLFLRRRFGAIPAASCDLLLRRRFALEAAICARGGDTPPTKSAAICSCGGDLGAIPAVTCAIRARHFPRIVRFTASRRHAAGCRLVRAFSLL